MLLTATNFQKLLPLDTFAKENYSTCEVELDVSKSEIVIKSRTENIFDIKFNARWISFKRADSN